MENASKALLIAGAILIAILLIGVAMMTMNGIEGITSQSGEQLDSMEIQMFNKKFTQYEGSNVSGSNVKALINNIMSNNNTYFGDASRQIELYIGTQKKAAKDALKDIGANYRYEVTTDASISTDGYVHKVTIKKK